ncbi:hypothetical protein QNO07_09315 [Streptomyces sp. 549]|uniref:hypothetical protein n=1 Tax=Streptomyces sp. 549 TaxID=3049076 RepID=UPI0024C290CF|nr:hypothetical protein [Streptomyces sp. 549]MDK1473617.1 hypothetical protein [Streptomyces sp. 549]
MTAVATSVFTAAQFNTFLRDNLVETAPAKAATAGSHFAVSDVNEIAERTSDTNADLGSGTTTSTSYGNLDAPAAAGPAVTVTTGPRALIVVHCTLSNSGGGSSRMGYEISGATSSTPADNRGIGFFGLAGGTVVAGTTVLHVGLTPGSNTFTSQYRVSSGTGTFSARRILVFPL